MDETDRDEEARSLKRCTRREALSVACAAAAWLVIGRGADAQSPGPGWTSIGAPTRFKAGQPVKIVLPGGKGLIVTRMSASALMAVSAVCTHQGCEVKWDTATKKLVCPCHGAEFTTAGKVLRGPARTPLPRVAALQKGGKIFVDARALATAASARRGKGGGKDGENDDRHDGERSEREHGRHGHNGHEDDRREHDRDDD